MISFAETAMSKPNSIELPGGARLPILYEDRSVLALDKPRGWMLVPFTWQKTNRNLAAAIASSIAAGAFWARSRNLKFLRHIHRLDADTSGILLFGKSRGAVESYGDLFESRQMDKTYLVVVAGVLKATQWTCALALAPDPAQIGRMKVDAAGKASETHFRVVRTRTAPGAGPLALIEAKPVTGRTHQIRVHLAAAGHPVVGDALYSPSGTTLFTWPLGLRAVSLRYADPFLKRHVVITAPTAEFLRDYGFQDSV